MGFWSGTFRCDRLGVDDCVVWWDAIASLSAVFGVLIAGIAALIAVAGVVVAALSAVAVFQLGRKANKIAAAPHEIAKEDREREGKFLLIYLHPEFLDVHSSIVAWRSHALKWDASFISWGEAQRRKALMAIQSLSFPMTEERISRLHLLDPEIGYKLARCLNTVRFLKLTIDATVHMKDAGQLRIQLHSLRETAKALDNDLGAIIVAAESEIYPSAGVEQAAADSP
ncbi:TPA: hypothetical protein ACKPZZ_002141 [Stenotrophomonas maltophilia]|nr:hypothetical protein [Stenotrophomonas maltophilia]